MPSSRLSADLQRILSPERALTFRITHMNNLEWLLRNGLQCENSDVKNPTHITIGLPDLIERRRTSNIPIPPGGSFADYVPFYFTPRSPMLLKILTGRGVRQRDKTEIVFLVTSLRKPGILDRGFVFTDRHATAAYHDGEGFYNALSELGNIDWDLLKSGHFNPTDADPGRSDRYQAEAMFHGHLSQADLLGIACYNPESEAAVRETLGRLNINLRIEVRPEWYFQ